MANKLSASSPSTPSSPDNSTPPGIDYAFRGADKLISLQHLYKVQGSLADFAKIDLFLIERMGQYIDASTIYEHLSELGYPHGYDDMLTWIAGRRFPSPAMYLVLSKEHLPSIKGFHFPMILVPNNQQYLDMARDPNGPFVDKKPSSDSTTVSKTRTGVRGALKRI